MGFVFLEMLSLGPSIWRNLRNTAVVLQHCAPVIGESMNKFGPVGTTFTWANMAPKICQLFVQAGPLPKKKTVVSAFGVPSVTLS